MGQKHVIIRGAFILTLAGLLTRFIGFFYRVFLSHTIGAEGMGIYQLVVPVYSMAFSLTAAGIQTALSRFVAGKVAVGDKKGAKSIFLSGLIFALGLSLIICQVMYHNAGFIAASLLKEERCIPLIQLLSFALPFGSVHACINGYYYGIRRTEIPAVSQLVEQLVRVGSAYLLYLILLEKGMAVTPIIAIIGMVMEEITSFLFAGTAILIHFGKEKLSSLGKVSWIKNIKSILALSAPLTANRVLINVLQSIEAICIPLRLRLFGLDTSSSLSVYGVLTGMAMPLILFPSAITSSVSIVLLPTVSEAQATGNRSRIAQTIQATIKYSLILGILFTGIFVTFGSDIGMVLYNNEMSCSFIRILGWICPFMYLNATLTSILNGLGKTSTTFFQSMAGLGIRIIFVWFVIPAAGITGYLWGVLASQLFTAFLSAHSLFKEIPFTFNAAEWLLKPSLILLTGIGISFFTSFVLEKSGIVLPSLLSLILLVLVMSSAYIALLWLTRKKAAAG